MTIDKKRRLRTWLFIPPVLAALIALDQWVKYLAFVNLKGKPSLPVLGDFLQVYYTTNNGAAWGIMKNNRWIFMVITAIILVFMVILVVHGVYAKYKLWNIGATLVLAGGLGNMIDRVGWGFEADKKVIDLFYIKIIDFPVFNVADIMVVTGAITLAILFLFIHKTEDDIKETPTEIDYAADQTDCSP